MSYRSCVNRQALTSSKFGWGLVLINGSVTNFCTLGPVMEDPVFPKMYAPYVQWPSNMDFPCQSSKLSIASMNGRRKCSQKKSAPIFRDVEGLKTKQLLSGDSLLNLILMTFGKHLHLL